MGYFVIFRNNFGIFTMVLTSVSFLGKFFGQILTWKIWFQPIQRIFHEKNGPNSPDSKFLKIPNCQSYDNFQKEAKNTKRFPFFLPSYLLCLQILQNHFLDGCPLWLHYKILERNPGSNMHVVVGSPKGRSLAYYSYPQSHKTRNLP